jgi:ankyrin repeat protein
MVRRRVSWSRRATCLAAVLVWGRLAGASAGEPILIQAARRGDAELVRSLLRQGTPADLRDARGATALMWASLKGDTQCVRLLLDGGADPSASSESGATALHWGAGDIEVVSRLLENGADPNARSKLGNTPLIAAAAYPRSAAVVRLLLEKGADLAARNHDGDTALSQAVGADELETVELVIARGARVDDTGSRPGGGRSSIVARAASRGSREMVELLLAQGGDPNQSDGTFVGHALNAALFAGNPEVAKLLIERGADLAVRSPIGGASPILWSAYTEVDDPSVAALLLAKRADVRSANEYGETALTWARNRGHPHLVRALEEAGGSERSYAELRRVKRWIGPRRREVDLTEANRATELSGAVEKGLRLLQASSDRFLEERECVSCHQQFLPAIALGWARDRGVRVDEASLTGQVERQLRIWSAARDRAFEMEPPVPAPVDSLGYGLIGLAALGYAADEVTDAMARYLAAVQRPEGRWRATASRPPMEHGDVLATVLALRALQLYPVAARREQIAARVARARAWLASAAPSTDHERAWRLLGLGWAGAAPQDLEPHVRELLASQRDDGGWAQLPGLASDAWATGLTLVALHVGGGLGVSHPAYERGVEFLLGTQLDDGSWWIPSRSWPFQTQFDSGFPHGEDQWISAGGTALAVMALLLALEPSPNAARDSAGSRVADARAAPPAVDFARDVQPILERSCAGCHSGEKPKSRFTVTRRESLLAGGESGNPAVILGDSASSPLIRFVAGEVEELEMPPLGQRDEYPALGREEIELLRAWIDQGAVWPEGAVVRVPEGEESEQ